MEQKGRRGVSGCNGDWNLCALYAEHLSHPLGHFVPGHGTTSPTPWDN